MAVIINNDEDRTELQDRITADLRERASKSSNPEGEAADFVEDSALLEGTKMSTKEGMFWVILAVLAILSLVVIFLVK